MKRHLQAEEMAKRPYLLMTGIEETTDNQPIYFARVLEMDGCFGQGETREESIEDLRLAMMELLKSKASAKTQSEQDVREAGRQIRAVAARESIDELVYELYGLSDDEIAIVEQR